MASIDGFITDTANTTPLQEQFITASSTVNGSLAINGTFYQFNPDVDEQSFTADMYSRLVSAGFPSSIGMIIDTSRNGWGGPNRPTAASTSTVVDTWVNATKDDRRPHRGAWCNPTGAGLGNFPQATPGGYPNSHLFAYIWAKPPGESDGSSTAIANNQGKGFDRMCDPTYAPPGAGWNGALTGALPNAPLSGGWFPAQIDQLVTNANPAVGGGGPTPSGQTPTPPATATPPRTGSPTPPRTASPTPPSTITPPPTGGTGTCAATWHVDNSWTGGFQATVTVTAGSSAITGWTANWTWPSGQSITNFWNATITSSGSAVTAKNASYNGALGAGGNTTFGMQMNGSAVTPALSCTAAGGATPPPATATPPRTASPTPPATATPPRTASPTPPATATPPRTASPTPPATGGSKTCSASWHIDNSWTGGFQSTVTVTAGSSAITAWTVTWTWPSGQTMVNFWNASVTTSGSSVTVKNLSYNGSLGAGGNTTFGMQLNGSSVTPTMTCSAT